MQVIFMAFKHYGTLEENEIDSKNIFVKNSNIGNSISTDYLTKLTTTPTDNVELDFTSPYNVRKTMLKVCNRNLGIKYTISSTKDMIKSFLYYNKRNQPLFVVLCKGWKELDIALKFHKRLSKCQTNQELKDLTDKYNAIITF